MTEMVYNSAMSKIIARWLRAHIGLVFLVGFLFWITVTGLQPDFLLIGWDNYSSYLGGTDGIFRTIFSTWRAYRGIGVPGDSESTDAVRQILLFALTPFVTEPMRDQVYIMACLWVGVLSLYVLVKRLAGRYIEANEGAIDIAAAFSGFMYAANLNTISTFYFPIITYITRYASIPLLVLVFDKVLHDRPLGIRTIAFFIGAVLFSAGSFITATVFFTTGILLGLYVLFQGAGRRGFLLFFVFVCLNAFWLVPFANYTREKSASLRLAPVFIDTNEAQLNQSPQSYSLWKQLILYPNFFYTRYTRVSDERSAPLFPLTEYIDSVQGQTVLGVFPAIALLGVGLIFLAKRKYYRIFWIPATYLLFIILSSQEQSPLGFIPALLNKIPYFKVVFRFGDTKFHPYIAFAGSLAVGVFTVLTLRGVRHIRRAATTLSAVLGIFLVVVPLVSVYRTYLTGDFLPKYLMVQLPQAYRTAATRIDNDPANGRVLHLPYDPQLYWRSHTWGYMGSAFVQYMLKNPYLDKTFEPASLETTGMFLELSSIIRDANQVVGEALEKRADALLAHLIRHRISWVMFDESVSPEMRIRNMRYWGSFNTTDSSILLETLASAGKVTRAAEYPIDLEPIAKEYTRLLGQQPQGPLGKPRLILYRVNDNMTTVEFTDSAVAAVPSTAGVIPAANNAVTLQPSVDSDTLLYPLLYKDLVVEPRKEGMQLAHPTDFLSAGTGNMLTVASGSGAAVEIRMKKEGENALLTFYKIEAPNIGVRSFSTLLTAVRLPLRLLRDALEVANDAGMYLSDWHILGHDRLSDIRLMIGDVVLPVPVLTSEEEQVVGSVYLPSSSVNVTVLRRNKQVAMNLSALHLTDMPNCFGDRTGGYEYEVTGTQSGQLTLRSQNGSTCLVYPVSDGNAKHVEIRLAYRANQVNDTADNPGAVPQAANYVSQLAKPNLLNVCIGVQTGDMCLNKHQILSMGKEGTVIIPSEITGQQFTHLRMATVPVGKQTQELTLTEGMLSYFDAVRVIAVTVPQRAYTAEITPAGDNSHVTIPPLLSSGSYYRNAADGWFVSNRPCETSGGYRTTRQLSGGMLSYIADCYNEFSLQLPFNSASAKLWSVSYALFSGKYPLFMLGDPFGHYVNQYLSLYQGYPEVPGMLSLQAPQQWYRPYAGDTVQSIIRGTVPARAYVLVPAVPELTDTRAKSYTIHQDSKNTGMVGLYDTRITEFPASWHHMAVRRGNPEKTYAVPGSVTSRDILPSLTEVTLADVTDADNSFLLVQRSGFDRQWAAYRDIRSLIVDSNAIRPVRCDGTFNCYALPSDSGRWYLFYTPERLAIIGWLVTILSAAIFAYKWRR